MQYSLALILIAQSKLQEAESLIQELQQYVEDKQRIHTSHPYNLYLTFALACIRTSQHRHKEAVSLYRAALEGYERISTDHPETLEYRSAYAAALINLDPIANIEESYTLQRETHSALEKKLGPDHPTTLTSLKYISEVQAVMGELEKALKTARKVRARREKVLKLQHPDTIAAGEWVNVLEARRDGKRGKSSEYVQDGRVTREERGVSLGEAPEKAEKRGIFGQWGRRSRNEATICDTKGATGASDRNDDDTDDASEGEKEVEKKAELNDDPEKTIFKIKRKQVGS
jgi:hypothetical protein